MEIDRRWIETWLLQTQAIKKRVEDLEKQLLEKLDIHTSVTKT